MSGSLRLPHLTGQDHSRHETAGHAEELVGDPVGFAGLDAVFRQVWLGSPLPGTSTLVVDGVRVAQQEGPIDIREVLITQLPTNEDVVFSKAHHNKVVGAGGFLTIADLDVRIPGELMGKAMIDWSRRCSGALGLLACALDERATFKKAGENLIVHDANGEVIAVADCTPAVRNFGPNREITPDNAQLLASADLTDHIRTACRWFLRGVTGGPSEDGVLLLATAVESLVNDPNDGKSGSSFNPRKIRAAFVGAGGDESDLQLDIGRCAGLRARVVHHGVEDHEQLRAGWYALELVARTLMRHELHLDHVWPVNPGSGFGVRIRGFVFDRHFRQEVHEVAPGHS